MTVTVSCVTLRLLQRMVTHQAMWRIFTGLLERSLLETPWRSLTAVFDLWLDP
jgi:hypothetical protein